MDAKHRELRNMMNEFNPNQFFTTHNSSNASKFAKPRSLVQQNQFLGTPFSFSNENLVPSSNPTSEGDSHEDSEIFSDISLSYINQLLMNEDENVDNFREHSALEAAEKPFYEILGMKYSPSASNHSLLGAVTISPCYENSSSVSGCGDCISISSGGPGGIVDDRWPCNHPKYQLPDDSFLQSSCVSRNCLGVNCVEERAVDFDASGFSLSSQLIDSNSVEVKSENEVRKYLCSVSGPRGQKNTYVSDLDLEEGRSVKQTSVSRQETTGSHEFDKALLCYGDTVPKTISDLREAFQQATIKSSKKGHRKGSGSGKWWGKRQPQREVVDVWTLLNHCAQMMAVDDRRSTNELLKQIRQHSSPIGDASERLAHYFANGIEARLDGSGNKIYNDHRAQRRTATDVLKAYQLFLAACPFQNITYFFSNQTIMDELERALRVHVVDFGMGFGFQWPSLIQRISGTPGGPPKLRITGIDFPQPGFRLSERIEETKRQLANYARRFKVPFEYKAIACRWEEVRIEDLDIDRDEVLVVNCLYQFHHLADESVTVNSPRNRVLRTIRKMKPDVFFQGVVNGSYGVPFFVTRFREALFNLSTWFDMLGTIVPREDEQRLLFEREVFGQVIANVVACEGLERIESPESYKQWQERSLRAGFVQQPLNENMVKKARNIVKELYHKDFNVHEDSQWLLQGWKGRILLAFSSWKPNNLT